MWVEGYLCLFFTAFIVVPANAAFYGNSTVVSSTQAQTPAAETSDVAQLSSTLVDQPKVTHSSQNVQESERSRSSSVIVTSTRSGSSSLEAEKSRTSTTKAASTPESSTSQPPPAVHETTNVVAASFSITSEALLQSSTTLLELSQPPSITSTADVTTEPTSSSSVGSTTVAIPSLASSSSTQAQSYSVAPSLISSSTSTFAISTASDHVEPSKRSSSSTSNDFTLQSTVSMGSSISLVSSDGSSTIVVGSSTSTSVDNERTTSTPTTTRILAATNLSSSNASSSSITASSTSSDFLDVLSSVLSEILNPPTTTPGAIPTSEGSSNGIPAPTGSTNSSLSNSTRLPTRPSTTQPVEPNPNPTGLPSFSVVNPTNSRSSNTSGLATSLSQIPASETRSNPTTTGRASTTTLLSPGTTPGISASTNASITDTRSGTISRTLRSSITTRVTFNTSSTEVVDTQQTSNPTSNKTSTSHSGFHTTTSSDRSRITASAISSSTRHPTGAISVSISDSSTLLSGSVTTVPSTTVPTSFVSSTITSSVTTSTTAAATGGDDKPAPLTKPQTAGVAIGSTGILIIALIAAVFLIKRHRDNAAKRNSSGSVYPEIAYLYDPPVGGNDDAEMSGGATGYGAVPQNLARNTPSPSRSPQNPFRDPIIPSPSLSPVFSGRLSSYGGLSSSNPKGNYAALAINPYQYNPINTAADDYPPMSPYGQPAPTLPPVQERASERWSDPSSDPFEHDLLLTMVPRSETPDSIMMQVAPPSTPRRSPRATPSPEHAARLAPTAAGRYSPDNGRLTPDSNNLTNASSSRPSYEEAVTPPQITTPQRAVSPPPIHKGWDEIKLDDNYDPYNSSNYNTPSLRGLTPSPSLIPAPLTPHPRSTRSGALSGFGLPLTVKKKGSGLFKNRKNNASTDGLGLEGPSIYGSPGPSVTQEEFPRWI
ncbi:hypothetical protein BDV96DRAFT_52056 [Lophiotrema nucula]|uniref:REJ domain-containing protein n=1 Tax=Lophiotrema nucula TaxID=690887 RepID=A0A6A5ZDA4_9PLEO|nr:hypothetical protein BDV96DRAFT_52056 [Lophiotrema nucula]